MELTLTVEVPDNKSELYGILQRLRDVRYLMQQAITPGPWLDVITELQKEIQAQLNQ